MLQTYAEGDSARGGGRGGVEKEAGGGGGGDDQSSCSNRQTDRHTHTHTCTPLQLCSGCLECLCLLLCIKDGTILDDVQHRRQLKCSAHHKRTRKGTRKRNGVTFVVCIQGNTDTNPRQADRHDTYTDTHTHIHTDTHRHTQTHTNRERHTHTHTSSLHYYLCDSVLLLLCGSSSSGVGQEQLHFIACGRISSAGSESRFGSGCQRPAHARGRCACVVERTLAVHSNGVLVAARAVVRGECGGGRGVKVRK